MAYVALAKLKKNSVGTTIAAPGIADDATTIPVSELAYFRDADGTLITRGIVIGYDDANQTYAEEITITGASGSSGAGNLTGATRGVNADGTIGQAKAWDAGTSIAVMVSSGIYNIIKDNFAAHESDKAPIASPTFTGTATIPTLKVTTDAAAGKVLVSDADGDLIYTLPKRTLFLSGAGGKASTTNGSGGKQTLEMSTNKVCFTGEKFVADASDKYCEWGVPMPDNWDLSTITAEFYFMTTSADASDHTIIFGLQAVAFSDGDTGDAAYGTAQEVTETIGSSIANKVIKTAATSAITVGGTPAKGDDVQFRVYRKGSDTFTGDVVLTRVRISYGTNNHSDE